ncbi:MAG: hypothetical protein IJT73_09630 [Selenomonadaceae bacterium]|nr:hypothetical protein [Selenomonadaceae bacterium]
MRKRNFDDEEELYIPEIEDVDEDIDIHGQYPRSNAGIALEWSPLEQQMFDLLLLNRFAQYDREILDEAAKSVIHLVKTFQPHEIGRIATIALMAFQLSSTENKNFEEEYQKYLEYIRKHPEDAEEIR